MTAAWLAVAVGPALLMVTAVNMRPDGQLHVTFIPGADGEAALVTTPGGRQVWIWDGQGDGEALAAATRPGSRGWRSAVDWRSGRMPGNPGPARALDPGRTPRCRHRRTVVRLGDGVELPRLPADDGWLLRYGEFTALLPPTLRPEAQATLLQSTLESLPVTLLKTPGAGVAAWPTAASRCDPGRRSSCGRTTPPTRPM